MRVLNLKQKSPNNQDERKLPEHTFKRMSNYVLLIFLFINVCSLLYYQFSNLKSDFYHEATYPYLYALSDLETNSLFTSRFSGREIAPISWTLINHALMVLGLKPSFLMVGISNTLFMAFAIAVICWFGRSFALNRTQTLLTLVLFTTVYGVRPFRYSWMDHLWIWPMNSYGIYEVLSLILCILAFKMISRSKTNATFFSSVLIHRYHLIVFFLFGLNHNRGLLQIYGPVGFTLLVLLVLHLQNQNRNSYRIYLHIFSATFMATLLGRLMVGVFTTGVPQYWQEPSQFFKTLDQTNFTFKLFSPLLTLLQVLGVSPTEGQRVVSPEGIRIFSVFALALMIVFIPVLRYLRGTSFQKIPLSGKFMFIHLLYFILVSCLTSLFTNSAGVVRYSIPLVISAIFFVPFVYSENFLKHSIYTIILITLLLPNIIGGALRLNDPNVVDYRLTSNFKLAQSLLDKNLTYGFAGPWTEDVLVIPFYTDNQIHISLIDVTPLAPHLHGDKAWFNQNKHDGKTFVAIPTDAVQGNEKIVKLMEVADSEYVVDKWTVLIFERNPVKLIGQLH